MLGGKKIGTGFYRIFPKNRYNGSGYPSDHYDNSIFNPFISWYRKKV